MLNDPRLNNILTDLQEITKDCRFDMHEPDDQGVSATVIGTDLDNAFGSNIVQSLVDAGCQELVVVIDNNGEKFQINLADLIALARTANVKK